VSGDPYCGSPQSPFEALWQTDSVARIH